MKLLFLLSLLIFIPLISAVDLRVTLDTPQAVFRNLSIGDTIDYFIGATNKNDFNITIDIIPSETLDVVFAAPTHYVLQPNQSIQVNYTITINKGGNYTDDISIKYKGNNTNWLLSQNLIFIVKEESTPQNEDVNTDSGGSSGSTNISTPINTTTETDIPIISSDENTPNTTQENITLIDSNSTPEGNSTLLWVILFIILIGGAIIWFKVKKSKKIKMEEENETKITDQIEKSEEPID